MRENKMNKIYLIKYNTYLIFRRTNILKENCRPHVNNSDEIWRVLFNR
jgi:hypothetical protein